MTRSAVEALANPSDDEVAAAKALLDHRKRYEDEQKASTLIECDFVRPCQRGCGAKTPVREMVYLQRYFYIDPYGCTGGDYWKEGEGGALCPSCGGHIRFYNSPRNAALKPYFKEVRRVYDK